MLTHVQLTNVSEYWARGANLNTLPPYRYNNKFCLSFAAEEEKAEVGRFAKNFLPILFNVHTQQLAPGESDPSRLAVIDTIRAYLTITDPKVAHFINP